MQPSAQGPAPLCYRRLFMLVETKRERAVQDLCLPACLLCAWLLSLSRELLRLSGELESQQVRACVLLETLETLQVSAVWRVGCRVFVWCLPVLPALVQAPRADVRGIVTPA